ncbi:class I SAM-dependent methyltransferase [Kushneria sp. EE4]
MPPLRPQDDMADHSDFSPSWLALREAADHRARDLQSPIETCRHWLASNLPRGPLRLVDLGCGSGSNLRYLSPRLPSPQHWCLIDQDAALLAHAGGDASSCHANVVGIDCYQRDLTRLDQALTQDLLDGVDIVTASALLDLVSQPWLEALIDRCASQQCAFWLAMSINGDNALIDHGDAGGDTALLEMDQYVQQLIRTHQQRDKGFNAALGTQAPEVAAALLEDAGYRVTRTSAPWRLDCADPGQMTLAQSLVQGWLEAALEQAPDQRQSLRQWHDRRQQDIASGRIAITVGHTDLFAVPATPGTS